MNDKAFVDTNVLLYLVSTDERKAAKAEELLRSRPLISVQVLNEFANASRRKAKLGWGELADMIAVLRRFCEVLPLTAETHDSARTIAERYQTSFYDAVIVASALDAECSVLYSEDLHHDLVVERKLRVTNPFR